MKINSVNIILNLAALLQGIALVAFPAASTILTSHAYYNFSSTTYGTLFIPQAIFSICAALCNPAICRRWGNKFTFSMGLIANTCAMSFLSVSATVMEHHLLAHLVLLLGSSCLGVGFGLTVPTLNAASALVNSQKIDSALLSLNALLGLGTALSPLLTSLFFTIGWWNGLPTLTALLTLLLLLFSRRTTIPGGAFPMRSASRGSHFIPFRFWLFASFALIYGVIETLNGNWLAIYMREHLAAPLKIQSIALTSFWGMVTVGRLFFALMQKFLNEELAYRCSPMIAALAFLTISLLAPNQEYLALLAFGATGFGCAILLPLTLSFGSKQLREISRSVPGMVISFYLIGYGVAAFGVGPLVDRYHLTLRAIFLIGALLSTILGAIALFITGPSTNQRGDYRR